MVLINIKTLPSYTCAVNSSAANFLILIIYDYNKLHSNLYCTQHRLCIRFIYGSSFIRLSRVIALQFAFAHMPIVSTVALLCELLAYMDHALHFCMLFIGFVLIHLNLSFLCANSPSFLGEKKTGNIFSELFSGHR